MHISRRHSIWLVAVALAIAMKVVSAQSEYDIFQRALVKERAEGKPGEAIALYEQVLGLKDTDRGLAARALVQIAGCYEKLGSPRAAEIYQRLVREYADQEGPASQARAALADVAARPSNQTSRPESAPRRIDLPLGATPSPDGTFIAVTIDNDVAVRTASTGQTRTLTHAEKRESVWEYAWSPDSRQLAYVWARQGEDKKRSFELRIVNADGSDTRTLLPSLEGNPATVAWAPDGQTIAIHSRQATGVFTLVSPAGARVGSLTSAHKDLRSVTFSPDGRYLVYDVPDPTATAAVYELDTRNGAERPLIKDSSENRFAAWTPRGGLLFTSDRSGTWDLWLAHVADGAIDGPPVRLRKDTGTLTPTTLTADGSFYYRAFGLTSDVFMVTIDPLTSKVAGRPTRVHQGTGHSANPMWSPDGRQLAMKTGPLWQPWPKFAILSMESGEEHEIAPKLADIAPNFTWSADGRSFFNTANPAAKSDAGAWNLYKIDARTGEFAFIAPFGYLEIIAPRSLPGGRFLTYTKNQQRIVRRDLDTGREDVVVDVGPGLRGNNPSPDGSSTAYVFLPEETSTTADLRVASLADSRSRTLVELTWDQTPMAGRGLCWTPDSKYILYFDRTSDKVIPGTTTKQSELWRVPVAGGPPERLGLTGGTLNSPAVSPDGRRLAYAEWIDRNGHWVFENFLPASELKAPIPTSMGSR